MIFFSLRFWLFENSNFHNSKNVDCEKTQILKVWERKNSKIKISGALYYFNCDKNQTYYERKLNLNCDKTQIVTKLKNWNCDTNKNSSGDKNILELL